jgi:hypothetical protein
VPIVKPVMRSKEGERTANGGGFGSAALFLLPGGRTTQRDFAEQ